MSCYKTTKPCFLPNVLYVKRKPEPLGSEVKNTVDGISNITLWIEIQEGKELTKSKEYKILRNTAVRTLCDVLATKNVDKYPVLEIKENDLVIKVEEDDPSDHSNPQNWKQLWYGDSWFGYIKTATNISDAESIF